MILAFEPYNQAWKEQFNAIRNELEQLLLSIEVTVIHIGSTSVEGLAAKPIIDVMIGLENEADLDLVPVLLKGKNYVYYAKYNEDMPYRRFFVALTDNPANLGFPECIDAGDNISEGMHDHSLRIAHIHAIPKQSEHWLRHIAFRDYLRTHSLIREEYQALKAKLIMQEWEDGNDYNAGKDAFIKEYEKKAVAWYKDINNI